MAVFRFDCGRVMITLVRSLLNLGIARLVRRKLCVDVGLGTRLRWLRLLTQKHGNLRVGNNSFINCRIDFDGPLGQVQVGGRCFIGASHLVCREKITIGGDVIISWGVTIVDHNSHAVEWPHRINDVTDWMRGKKSWSHVDVRPVEIRDKVWIGFGATILKGVVVNEGAVIGAGSVATRDVPAYTVVAGNPARMVRQIEDNVHANN